MLRFFFRGAALCAALVTFAACDSQDPFEIPTSTTPPETFTDVYEGAINVNGARTHTFSTQASGTVTATLKALAPDQAAVVGLALGTWNGTSCQVVISRDEATQGATVVGAVSTLGSLCVRIYDVGRLTQATEYQIEVLHP